MFENCYKLEQISFYENKIFIDNEFQAFEKNDNYNIVYCENLSFYYDYNYKNNNNFNNYITDNYEININNSTYIDLRDDDIDLNITRIKTEDDEYYDKITEIYINDKLKYNYMFRMLDNCLSLSNIFEMNTNYIVDDISSMFYNCISLLSLPDRSKWIY